MYTRIGSIYVRARVFSLARESGPGANTARDSDRCVCARARVYSCIVRHGLSEQRQSDRRRPPTPNGTGPSVFVFPQPRWDPTRHDHPQNAKWRTKSNACSCSPEKERGVQCVRAKDSSLSFLLSRTSMLAGSFVLSRGRAQLASVRLSLAASFAPFCYIERTGQIKAPSLLNILII